MAMDVQGAISAEQIARSLGVSRATVFRSLNNDKRVRPETIERVQKLARQFNYQPRASARALGKGRSHQIGVVFSMYQGQDAAGRFRMFDEALNGIRMGLAKRDYVFTFAEWLESAVSDEGHRASRMFREVLVDGVLMIQTPQSSALEEAIRSQGLPYVAIDATDAPGRMTVTLNQERAAELAVEHLVALGHRRIAFVAADGGPRVAPSFMSPRRDAFPRGYAKAMTRAGLRLLPGWDGEWDTLRALTYHWESPQPPTALICYDADLAITAGNWLAQRGLAMPEDVSLVALVDKGLAEACHSYAYFMPKLTCIANMDGEMAEVGVELLHSLVEGIKPDSTDLIVLEPTLIVRDSTAPCKDLDG